MLDSQSVDYSCKTPEHSKSSYYQCSPSNILVTPMPVTDNSTTTTTETSVPTNITPAPVNASDNNHAMENRIAQRKKQIEYGKNTLGYDRYRMLVPVNKRGYYDIWTPDVNESISKRRFDGKIRKWRRDLHKYDPKTDEQIKEVEEYLKSQGIEKNKNLNVVSIDEESVKEAQVFTEDDIWDLL